MQRVCLSVALGVVSVLARSSTSGFSYRGRPSGTPPRRRRPAHSKVAALLSEPVGFERTFTMIKPDGVQRGLIGDIIHRFEQEGFRLVAMKMLHPQRHLVEQHYMEHAGKAFFPDLVDYVSRGPVVAMVWEAEDAVIRGRRLIGKTNPLESPEGTIRGDFALIRHENIIHGSDSPSSAIREMLLWFGHDATRIVDQAKRQRGFLYTHPEMLSPVEANDFRRLWQDELLWDLDLFVPEAA